MSTFPPTVPAQQRSQVTGFTISELPPMTFPPLPPIKDKALYDVVITHSSFYQAPRTSMELHPTSMVEDYEKLEHVGDAILGAMVAIILHDLFPLLGEGPATTLKASLVSNATLARISDKYEIPAKLRANPSAARLARMQVKTRASMFEAWIAGVFYSVLNSRAAEEHEGGEGEYEGSDEAEEILVRGEEENGKVPNDYSSEADKKSDKVDSPSLDEVPVVAQGPISGSAESAPTIDERETTSSTQHGTITVNAPLTATNIEEPDDTTSSPSSSQTPSDSTITLTTAFQHLTILSNQNLKYRWFAMIALDDWLRPLFTPIAHYALAELRKEQIRLTAIEEEERKLALSDMAGIGSVGLLHAHVTQAKIGALTFEAEAVEGNWKMVCTIVKPDGNTVTTEAIRKNKQLAKTWAAHLMCEKLGI